jgi:hypothetical protein
VAEVIRFAVRQFAERDHGSWGDNYSDRFGCRWQVACDGQRPSRETPVAARRLLALALVLDGCRRTQAAEQCGMDRQTLRD